MNTSATPDTQTIPFTVHKRAYGRSLVDFSPLLHAEQILLDQCALGEEAEISDAVPVDEADPKKSVRANFLRFLLLGGDEQAPVHEQGIQLQGAWIQGPLDLDNCRVQHRISLTKCKFDGPIVARDGHIAGLLYLSGSHLLKGLYADRLRCDSGIFLNDSFKSFAEVRLGGAQIGDDLSCTGGQFEPLNGTALSAEGAVIKGSVFLNQSFKATGEVRLLGAQIGGDLTCNTGQFSPREGDALNADRTVVKGGVYLNQSVTTTGMFRFLGAQIGGDLDCSGWQFTANGNKALHLQTATIQGGLLLRDLSTSVRIDATSAQIGILVDESNAWGKCSGLDGLVYGSLGGTAPTNAVQRITWLKQQSDKDLGEDEVKKGFRPQPWKQLQKVLLEMGHEADAREVGVAFEKQLRTADRIGQISDASRAKEIIPFVRRKCLRGLHWLFGALAGYGYRPMRLFMSMVAVWLFCAIVYWWLALPPHSALGPTDPLVFQNKDYAACTAASKGNWFLCGPLPAEYTTFSPLAYSLDILLPLVDLGQEKSWGPLVPTPEQSIFVELSSFSPAHRVRLLNWFQILYGWMASLLFVAIVSGISRRSEMEK